MNRFVGTLIAALLLLASRSMAKPPDYFPPPDTEGGWRTLKTSAEIRKKAGMDLARLEEAYAFTERCSQNGGLLVVRHGYLVFEKYYGRAGRDVNPDMASTGKAYTSIAVGIMLQEKRNAIPEGLNQKVFTERYLPEAFPLDDPRKADITLGQLLCMSSGHWPEGGGSGVADGRMFPLKPVPGQDIRDLDMSSLRTPLWTAPGGGYAYSSPAPHIASMVLRRLTGMDLKEYIDEKLAKPMGWGAWDYGLHRGDYVMPHANGAGNIAVHATDALRFGYCLLRNGRWGDKQLVPPDYIALCNKPSPFNPHTPYTLMFEQNSDGHVPGAPRDAYYKSGAGGFGIFVVPSLDIVIYKMGGPNGQYDPTLTRIPQPAPDTSRDNWKPITRTPFNEGSMGGDDGLRRVLQLVCWAARN